MSRSLYVVVFVSVFLGCAAPQSGPTEYQRGVTTPIRPAPRVTHVPAGAGMGTPGSPAQGYPRSPHKRILPETPETRRGPGFWAAESPRASAEDPSNPLTWRHFFVPEDLDPRQAIKAQECADLFKNAAETIDATQNNVVLNLHKALSLSQWMCFMAKAYRQCIDEKHKTNEASAKLKRLADLLEAARCVENLPKDAERVLWSVKQQLSAEQRNANTPKN